MLVEMDWKTWKQIYPDSQVANLQTGFSRTYGTSPYGNYSTDNDFFLFPVSKDGRLPSKERVLAITNDGSAKVYRFEDFAGQNLILDTYRGGDYLIVGNQDFMVAFEPDGEHKTLEFTNIFDGESDILLEDNEGNQWDIFGNVVSGSRLGQQLKAPAAFMAYWFSIPAFYQTAVYNN